MIRRIASVLRMIKFQHSIFALPFAALAAVLAAWRMPPPWYRALVEGPFPGWPMLLIVLCCVFARSAAMAFNRLVDQPYDAANPRTSGRELPRGVLSRRFVALFTALNIVGFVVCAGLLNDTALALSPLVLVVLLGYSYTKRYTALCHFVLGLALGMAPAGAWIAVTGRLDLPPVVLALAVLFWTAGFDIIYACQDYEYDAAHPDLHSLPKKLGVAQALRLATALHVVAFALFYAFGDVVPLGRFYRFGTLAAAGLLLYQHSIIGPKDLSRVDAAFFTTNGLLAILLCSLGVMDVALAAY